LFADVEMKACELPRVVPGRQPQHNDALAQQIENLALVSTRHLHHSEFA
jgi:hypothetical protein